MDEYSTLLQKIVQVPSLAKYVETLAEDPDVLNLVTMDWKEQLENHAPFQEFQQDARHMFQREYLSRNSMFRIQTLNDHVTPLKVIVAGVGRLIGPYEKDAKKKTLALILEGSPVMDMLLNTITNDVDHKTVKLNDSCKLDFKLCSMCCQYCSSARESMIAHNIHVDFQYNLPCIADTLEYNGKNIVNRFGSQILRDFPREMVTIVKIELNRRYFYKTKKEDNIRVGGSVFQMLCFPISNLKSAKVELGDLDLIAETETILDEPLIPDEVPESGKKRVLEEDDNDDDDDEDDDSLLGVKKTKTWQDDFDVTEDTIIL